MAKYEGFDSLLNILGDGFEEEEIINPTSKDKEKSIEDIQETSILENVPLIFAEDSKEATSQKSNADYDLSEFNNGSSDFEVSNNTKDTRKEVKSEYDDMFGGFESVTEYSKEATSQKSNADYDLSEFNNGSIDFEVSNNTKDTRKEVKSEYDNMFSDFEEV